MNAAMVGLMAANPAAVLPSTEESASKKIRKPYTITKSRESWTEQEHDKFLEALQLFDRDWKKIEAFVGSKTVIQIRSHAQKYFLKVQKNGTGEHVPPPRPKRKSSQPYPQKAVKTASTQQSSRTISVPHTTGADFGYMLAPQQCNMYVPGVPPPVSPWVHHATPAGSIPFNYKDAHQPELATGVKNQSNNSSSGSSTCPWPQRAQAQEVADRAPTSAAPSFSEVYKFIGSIFDPDVTGHLKKLRDMAPIDRETVLLLIRNLATNLSSPDFDERKLFISVYEADDKSDLDRKRTTPQDTCMSAATVGDVSKHQRHPYDGGGGGFDVAQDEVVAKDELDYISEVLEGSQMDLAFDSEDQIVVPSSTEEESFENLSTALNKADVSSYVTLSPLCE